MKTPLLSFFCLVACVPAPTVYGSLDGVSSTAELAADGTVESISLVFQPSKFTGTQDLAAYVQLPEEAKGKTIIDHLRLDWRPKGHPPNGQDNYPHIDTHFNTASMETLKAIDCTDATPMKPDHLPSDYYIQGYGPPPGGMCIVEKGVFAQDTRAPGQDPAMPGPLETSVGLGVYGGRIVSIDPLIAMTVLDKHEPIDFVIRQPEVLGTATAWPTKGRAEYDMAMDTWTLTLSGFVPMS